jgi:WD40 repeat protein
MKNNLPLSLIVSFFVVILSFSHCTKENPSENNSNNLDLSPPENIVVSTIPPNKVSISWDVKAQEKVFFSIERKIGFSGSFIELGGGYSSRKIFTDSISVPDSVYTYRLRMHAYGSFGNYSGEVGIKINLAAPSNLSVLKNDEQSIDLSWNANSTDHRGFILERKIASGPYTVIGMVDSVTTSYSDTSILTGSVEVRYRVKTAWEGENGTLVTSGQSNEVIVTPVFLAPANMTVSVVAETSAVLHWIDNTSTETHFVIEKRSGSTFIPLDSVLSNITTYNDHSSFITNTHYAYRIRAKSNRRISQYSNSDSSFLTFTAPTSLVASVVPERGIQLQWQDNSTIESRFHLERRERNSSTYLTVADNIPANTTSYFDSTTIKVDSVYYIYRIRAITQKGSSTLYSNLDSVRFVFSAPSNLHFQFLSPTSLQVQWQNNTSFEDGLKIEYIVSSTNKRDSITLSSGTTSHTFSSLNDISIYQYRIKSFKGNHESKYSNPIRAFLSTSNITPIRTISDSVEIVALTLDTNGTVSASGGTNGIIRLWNTGTGAEVRAFTPDTFSAVHSISINPQNTLIAAVFEDGSIRVWNIDTGTLLWKKNTGSGGSGIIWNSVGTSVVTGHFDHTIRIWNSADGTNIRTLSAHQSSVTSVSFSHSGAILISASIDQSVKVWSTSTWNEIKSITNAHTGIVNCATAMFSGDSLIASVGNDGLIRLWNSSTGSNITTLNAHLTSATTISSPNLFSMISTGSDNRIKLWKPFQWSLLKNISAHTGPIISSALSKNRKVFAAGSTDKTMTIWNIDTEWIEF